MSKYSLRERVWIMHKNQCASGMVALDNAFDEPQTYVINLDGGDSVIVKEHEIFKDKQSCQEFVDKAIAKRYAEFRDDKMSSIADLLAYLILDKMRHDIIPDEIEHDVMFEKASQFTGLDMKSYVSVYKSLTHTEENLLDAG